MESAAHVMLRGQEGTCEAAAEYPLAVAEADPINPASPRTWAAGGHGRLAQPARAPALHAGCRGFESLIAHHALFADLYLAW